MVKLLAHGREHELQYGGRLVQFTPNYKVKEGVTPHNMGARRIQIFKVNLISNTLDHTKNINGLKVILIKTAMSTDKYKLVIEPVKRWANGNQLTDPLQEELSVVWDIIEDIVFNAMLNLFSKLNPMLCIMQDEGTYTITNMFRLADKLADLTTNDKFDEANDLIDSIIKF
jgi:hypothetical protein